MGLVTNTSAPHMVLSGEVDISVAPSLRDSGTEMARSVAPGRLEIDLGDVTFMAMLARRSGVSLTPNGKTVWCTVPVVRSPAGR